MQKKDSVKPSQSNILTLRSFDFIIAIFIFAAALFIVSYTIPKYGITWDEPLSFFAGVKRIDKWVKAVNKELHQNEIRSALSREITAKYWQPPDSTTQKYDFFNNHPPITRFAGYLSWLLLKDISNDLFSMRFASAITFALMVTVIFLFGSMFSRWAGFIASIFILTMPRLFVFSHFLTTEIFLTAFWVFCAFCFWQAMQSNKRFWHISFWLIFGIAINIKFTALFIPLPLILFALLYHRNQLFHNLVWSPLALLLAYILNPTWWHDPIFTFFKSHILLSLKRTSYFNPSVYYLGKVYSNAPWHYPIVQTLLTVPVIILIFLLISVFFVFWKKRDNRIFKYYLFSSFNMLILLFIFCLPGTPRYDGVRLFLPFFPFLGLLAAYSAAITCEAYLNLSKKIKYKLVTSVIGIGILIIVLGQQAKQIIIYIPYELSYYNELSGGISGAFDLGMEATYWLEAITPDFVSRINRILPPNASLGNYPEDGAILHWYQQNGFLRKDIRIIRMNKAEFVIVVNRRASLRPEVLQHLDISHKSVAKTELDSVPLVVLFAPNPKGII